MEATITTDFVPWRLDQYYKTLTYEQAIFLLDGSLSGFRELLHRLKAPFMVDKSMIGVDAYGEVKVWWNPSFNKNQFSNDLSTNVKLKDMILGLINCLAIKMNES